jgi:RND superfamily putative drug exporter
VPPAAISADKTTAVITVPMDKTEVTEEITTRVEKLRELAKQDIPAGLDVYVTGPEGFQADLAGVFAGADFTLLLSTVVVVAVLLLITYRSPTLWLVPLLVVGTADGMSGQLARRVANAFGIYPDASVTGILSVLVFGAGTNYALLLIARYREELLSRPCAVPARQLSLLVQQLRWRYLPLALLTWPVTVRSESFVLPVL